MITLTTETLLPKVSKYMPYIKYVPSLSDNYDKDITSYVGQACLLSDISNNILIDNNELIINELIKQSVPFATIYDQIEDVPSEIFEYDLAGNFILCGHEIDENTIKEIIEEFNQSEIGALYMNSKYSFVWGLTSVYAIHSPNMLCGCLCRLIKERLSGLYILEFNDNFAELNDCDTLDWIYNCLLEWADYNNEILDDNNDYKLEDLFPVLSGNSIAEIVRKLDVLRNKGK